MMEAANVAHSQLEEGVMSGHLREQTPVQLVSTDFLRTMTWGYKGKCQDDCGTEGLDPYNMIHYVGLSGEGCIRHSEGELTVCNPFSVVLL